MIIRHAGGLAKIDNRQSEIVNALKVAVEDANHTNPYMFAGVRYDVEIGLEGAASACYTVARHRIRGSNKTRLHK